MKNMLKYENMKIQGYTFYLKSSKKEQETCHLILHARLNL